MQDSQITLINHLEDEPCMENWNDLATRKIETDFEWLVLGQKLKLDNQYGACVKFNQRGELRLKENSKAVSFEKTAKSASVGLKVGNRKRIFDGPPKNEFGCWPSTEGRPPRPPKPARKISEKHAVCMKPGNSHVEMKDWVFDFQDWNTGESTKPVPTAKPKTRTEIPREISRRSEKSRERYSSAPIQHRGAERNLPSSIVMNQRPSIPHRGSRTIITRGEPRLVKVTHRYPATIGPDETGSVGRSNLTSSYRSKYSVGSHTEPASIWSVPSRPVLPANFDMTFGKNASKSSSSNGHSNFMEGSSGSEDKYLGLGSWSSLRCKEVKSLLDGDAITNLPSKET